MYNGNKEEIENDLRMAVTTSGLFSNSSFDLREGKVVVDGIKVTKVSEDAKGETYRVFSEQRGKNLLIKVYDRTLKMEDKGEFMCSEASKDLRKLRRFFPDVIKDMNGNIFSPDYAIFEDLGELRTPNDMGPEEVVRAVNRNYEGLCWLIQRLHRNNFGCLHMRPDSVCFRENGDMVIKDVSNFQKYSEEKSYEAGEFADDAKETECIAPEILEGQLGSMRALDVWSVAVTMCQMMMEGSDLLRKQNVVLSKDFASMIKLNIPDDNGLDPILKKVIIRSLAQDPSKRPNPIRLIRILRKREKRER
ncbi:MAG: hypothetical protein LBB24_02175, partial [Rickettsiales bacterium]|nr:hypothetical protein [Rickettsiales bacterium]